MAHADNIVTDEELKYMSTVLTDIKFSEEQTQILKDDIINPKKIEAMFDCIDDMNDRLAFFEFARDLVWSDGDFAPEEQDAIVRLKRAHYKKTNVDDMIGNVKLEFEDDDAAQNRAKGVDSSQKGKWSLRHALHSYRDKFLNKLN